MITTLAGPGRRAAGFALDVLLFAVTLGVGWLAWSIWLWSSARTPGKQILRMRVVDGLTGEAVGWRRMALRQAVYGIGIAGLFGAATVGVGWAVSAVFVLSPTRQALWDRLAFTTVALVPRPAGELAHEAAADTVPIPAAAPSPSPAGQDPVWISDTHGIKAQDSGDSPDPNGIKAAGGEPDPNGIKAAGGEPDPTGIKTGGGKKKVAKDVVKKGEAS